MIRTFFATVLAAGLGLAAPVQADTPQPFPDFTFKRVTPPAPGTSQRINIQITAPTPAPPVAPQSQAPSVGTPSGDWASFWDAVGTGFAQSSPARLASAEAALAATGTKGPGLQAMQGLATRYGRTILAATVGHPVSPALVLSIMAVESGGRAEAVSGAGAQGLMQLMPATAAAYGVSDAFDPEEAIPGAVRLLADLLDTYGGDVVLALAAYNAGETALAEAGGVPAFAETRAYVPKVLSAWGVARALCLTPPDLVTDGCVFATLAASGAPNASLTRP